MPERCGALIRWSHHLSNEKLGTLIEILLDTGATHSYISPYNEMEKP